MIRVQNNTHLWKISSALSQKLTGKLNSFHWHFKFLSIPNLTAGMISKPCNKDDQLKKESLLLNDSINIHFLLKNFLKLLPKTEFLADSTVINSFLGTHRNNSSAYRKERNAQRVIYMICQVSQIHTNFKLQVVYFFLIKILPSLPL